MITIRMKVLLILLIFLVTNVCSGQLWYFNNIYNPNNTWSSGLSVAGCNGGYFGCTISSDSISGYYYSTCTFRINGDGEIQSWKCFGKTGYDYYPGYYGSMIASTNSYLLFGSVNDLASGLSKGILYKFNSTGDTLFTKCFTSDTYNRLIGRTTAETWDYGFALLGEVSEWSNYSNLVLIRTDSLGNELWRSHYGTDIDENANSIIQTPDYGFVFGCWSRIPGINNTADPLIFKTDSLGNLEWSLNLGGPYKDDKAMVCNTHDSCIMVLTAYADSMLTPEFAYTRINLIKIDLNGDTIWNKKYGPSKPINFVSNIILKPSAGFLLCGHSMIEPTVPHAGWIMEVDSSGDSLWYRDYYYYPSGPDQSLNYLYDLSITSDNGIVGVGQAYTAYPPNNTQKMWVLKVDSIGCEFPNCWVGMEEHGGAGAREDGKVVLFPNPADDKITISAGNTGFGEMEEVSIYNNMGILLKRHRPDKQSEFRMDVSGLPAGIYFIQVKGNQNASCVRKLVVGR